MTDNNPYAAPVVNVPGPHRGPSLPPEDLKKIESIVKDAGQFWLALILCLFCSGIGGLIVPIWYTVRLLQWGKFSKRYPELMASNAPAGSLPAKFRSSQWKLIVGLAFGCFMLFLTAVYVAFLVVGSTVIQ